MTGCGWLAACQNCCEPLPCKIATLLKTDPFQGGAMKPRFNEAKATQAAALPLKYRGGRMISMNLIKSLYLVDRTALIRRGRPVTFDSYCSLRYGPILSRTLNLITGGAPQGEPLGAYPGWSCVNAPPIQAA